jgi:hypothetical protein
MFVPFYFDVTMDLWYIIMVKINLFFIGIYPFF